MSVSLYGILISHPCQSVKLIAEHKGIEHRNVWLIPALHPLLLRARGFRGGTVPAMKAGGRRFQNSRLIARALEELQPEPRIFPEEPEERARVEQAERWGEQAFQPVPRQVGRWVAANRPEFRRAMAAEMGMPAPKLFAVASAPLMRSMASKADANDESVRATLAGLPALLGRVEALLEEGTIGSAELNAADFQIGTTMRILLCNQSIEPLIADRPSARWARELMPEYPLTVPPLLPPEWLEPLRA